MTTHSGPVPRVSVGLPVYNGEQYLAEAIKSFLAQTFTDFELVISDNASSDQTREIARAFAAKDDRIRYHRNEKNLGLAVNHNRAFELARGEYFKWAAYDDYCLPNYLARCVEVLDRDPTVVLTYPRTQFLDAVGNCLDIHDPGWNLQSDQAYERLSYAIHSSHWANAVVGLLRSSALAKTRLMPSYPGGDFRVLGELSLLGKFYEIPESLFVRRLHPGSSSKYPTAGTYAAASVSLPRWAIGIDHLRIITQSQLPFQQKLSLTRSLFQRMRWQRQDLLKELWAAVTAYFSTAPDLREGEKGGQHRSARCEVVRNESAARN